MSQIVLHRSGLDPDFHYTRKFLIDVDGIVGRLCMYMYVYNMYNMSCMYIHDKKQSKAKRSR